MEDAAFDEDNYRNATSALYQTEGTQHTYSDGSGESEGESDAASVGAAEQEESAGSWVPQADAAEGGAHQDEFAMNEMHDMLGLDVTSEQQHGVAIQPQVEHGWSDYSRSRLAAQIQAVKLISRDAPVPASLMIGAGGMVERSLPPSHARSRLPPTTRSLLFAFTCLRA